MRTRMLLTAVVLLAGIAHTIAQSATVTGYTGRPVAEALLMLQQVYGIPINYEDPPYAYGADLQDVTDQVSRDPTGINRIIVPRGTALSFTYTPPPVPDPAGALRRAVLDVIARDAATVGFKRFAVAEANGLSVLPVLVRDARGQVVQVQALLSTPITLVADGRTTAEVLRDVCAQVSANAGQHVAPVARGNLFLQHTSQVVAMNEPASAVLSRIFSELQPAQLSWRLLYDPGLQEYALNIMLVSV